MTEKLRLDGEKYPTPYSGVCTFCKHLVSGVDHICAAFPNGIPPEIWEGQNDHTQSFPGDGGIQYERRTLTHE